MNVSTIRNKAILLAGILSISISPFAGAVVAKPGIQTVRQPDGTTLSIILQGDAFNHRAYTTDGYLLTTDSDGYYVFATCGSDGMPVATTLRGADPEERTEETTAAVLKIDQNAVAAAFSLRHEAYRAEKNRIASKRVQRGPGLFSTHFPSTGEQHSIAILVEFADKKFSLTDPHDYYHRMLNQEGFGDDGATGSARDYFISNSNGIFTPTFDVYGPVQLAQPMKYYGKPDGNEIDSRPEEMVIEACSALDGEINFKDYDKNGDGVIDNVFIFYPGYGENDGGGADAVWPHSSDLTKILDREYYFDGMMLDHYACTNELKSTDRPDGIGTFCHEFSHVMGLPDLYATVYTSAFTPGEYDVMDAGSYNNESRTPPLYSSFERYALGYIEPEVLTQPGEYSLNPLSRENRVFLLPTDNEDEYFLLENRQQEGSDLHLPGHGMLVWHIDFDQNIWDSNSVNNFSGHQYVDLVEADNKKTKGSRAGDPFPGSKGISVLNNSKKPYLRSWSETPLQFELSDITESDDGAISFRLSSTESDVVKVNDTLPSKIIVDMNMVSITEGTAAAYDLSGRKVADIGTTPVALTPGMYLIRCGLATHKITIR